MLLIHLSSLTTLIAISGLPLLMIFFWFMARTANSHREQAENMKVCKRCAVILSIYWATHIVLQLCNNWITDYDHSVFQTDEWASPTLILILSVLFTFGYEYLWKLRPINLATENAKQQSRI